MHKLEDEIAKLIKYIGAAIVKDATPDDLAVLTASGTGPMGNGGSSTMPSGSSSDVNSEIGRIRKLPGYQRLQRQLFINLMSAKQDNTDRNVRVLSEFRAVSSHTERPDTSSNAYGDDSSTAISVVPPAGAPLQNGRSKRSDIPVAGVDTIDRATVKLISEMVREKNSSNNATNNNLGKYARR